LQRARMDFRNHSMVRQNCPDTESYNTAISMYQKLNAVSQLCALPSRRVEVICSFKTH
jgi:hypothetical protein